jgi:putative colanic acid biosynthesis acetyltransferase WcaF
MIGPQATPASVDPAARGEDHADRAFARAQISAWTLREKIARALWMIVRGSLFRWSWHDWYGWRRFLLRAFGARIGRQVVIRPSARVEIPWLLSVGDYSSIGDFAIVYNLGPIAIGRRVSISQYAHLCAGTHDFSRWSMPLLRPPIVVGDDVWIAAEAFVGPGVSIGEGAILGARACAFRDVPPWTINVGQPARVLRQRPRPTD